MTPYRCAKLSLASGVSVIGGKASRFLAIVSRSILLHSRIFARCSLVNVVAQVGKGWPLAAASASIVFGSILLTIAATVSNIARSYFWYSFWSGLRTNHEKRTV